MTLAEKQFEALEKMVKGEKKITYEDVKSYVEELAAYLSMTHDCHASRDDGCDACSAIINAEDAILINLQWLERTTEISDEAINHKIDKELAGE